MAKPIVQLGHLRVVVDVDRETHKPSVKRYRIVFTDAVGQDATVPDEGALADAVDTVIELTKDQDIDGSIFEPLP
jgi:hypothetical protein